MKILHLCLGCFYIDNYSYQENMLPRRHKAMGHEVRIVASLFTFDQNGKGTYLPHGSHYTNEDGIPVTRLEYRRPRRLYRTLRRYRGLREELDSFLPDLIFIHGCQFLDIAVVVDYLKRHPGTRVYVDNHSDFSNSATNFLSKNILHKIIWRRCARKIEPYTTKFYGVLPARVDFLREIYRLPPAKCELLVMGADDDAVARANTPEVRCSIREKYGIGAQDFLVVFGGKIDGFKRQSLLLMDAVNQIEDPRLKLIVFGSVNLDLQAEINARCSDRVQYIGWVKGDDSYPIFAAADLACFPGRHSVYWEQVAGLGIPMLVKHWDGTTHIDLGGNARFLYHDSTEEIAGALREIMQPDTYAKMKAAAERGAVTFSYRDIARRAIEE